MDIYLNKEKINYVKNVLSTSLSHEETMEMIVPDALPDILRIVDTDANVFLRSKSTDAGRVTVSGLAEATVLYTPDGEEGIRKLELELPFTMGATENEITPNSRVTANVNVSAADASMVNPRKIIVRLDLMADVNCYNDAEMMISSGLEDDGDAAIEVMTGSGELMTTSGVKEKTFVISEEMNIPAGNPPIGQILKYKADLTTEDTKVVGNKLIVHGSAFISLLYLPPSGGDIAKMEFAPEFSQILELDNTSYDGTLSDGNFDINLMLTNAYFDAEQSPHNPEGRVLLVELHAVAQCVTSEKKTINYISDMYSTKFTLEPELKDFAVDNNANAKANAVFIGRLDTPTNVSRVIALNVHPGAVIVSPNSANTTLKCPLNVNAMYLGEDGRLMSTARQYEVEANTDNHEGMKCKATAVCGRDVYGVAAGNGIELRIPIEINVKESGQMKVNMLSNLSYDETAPTDYSKAPSLVVSHAPKDDSLWSLAKKYRSTRKLIMAANGLENEDSLTAGQLLIIPKK